MPWRRRLRGILHSNTRAIETLLTLSLLYWAVTLFREGNTFDTAQSFTAMRDLMSEELWGGVMGLTASFSILALLINAPKLRVLALLFNTTLWTFVAIMFFQSSPLGIGWGIYALYASFSCWACWRLGLDSRRHVGR